MSTINVGGGYESSSKSSQYWTLRDRLRNLTTALSGNASLDLRFINQYYYKKDDGADAEQSAALELFDASVTRGSKGWYPEWDFTNGGVCGRLTEYAANALRYGSQGLLEEASSTNLIMNPRCEGAATGTPGTAPENWNIGSNGATSEIVGSGYENGWPYVDIRFSGSTTTASEILIEQVNTSGWSNGDSFTYSVGLKLLAGDLSNFSIASAAVIFVDSGSGERGRASDDILTEIDDTHKRFVQGASIAVAPNGTTNTISRLNLNQTGVGAVGDFTLRIYAPQLEQKSAPTSPILPAIGTPAASTRATETVTQLASISRASRKSNAGEWDFTNGGEVGTYREFLPNVPAVTGKGLLVEEGSTNEIRNPRAEGAVAGTPGALPTHWGQFSSGVSLEVVGSGTENGWPYTDIRYSGTPASSISILFEQTTQVVAADGETWTVSAGFKIASGDLTNMTGVRLQLVERTSGGSAVKANSGSALTPDGTHKRFSFTSTLSGGGTTGRVVPRVELLYSGGAIDITLRIYAPQLEQKAYPTSPILPPKGTLAASTRAADDIEVGDGAWIGGGASTMYVEYAPNVAALSGNGQAAELNDGTANTRYRIQQDVTTGNVNAIARTSGADVASLSLGGTVAGETIRAAFAIAENDFAASRNGETQQTDTSGAVVTPNQLQIGAAVGGSGGHINAYIKQIRYFPRRVTNAELENLVGNT